MRRLFTLIQRELSVFYYSPIAYILLFFFLILNGLSFWFALALLNRAPSENTVVQVFFNSGFFLDCLPPGISRDHDAVVC